MLRNHRSAVAVSSKTASKAASKTVSALRRAAYRHPAARRRAGGKGFFESLETRRMLAAHVAGDATVYATIQAAVDAATPGGIVSVDAGVYPERVTISKPLTLLGARPASTPAATPASRPARRGNPSSPARPSATAPAALPSTSTPTASSSTASPSRAAPVPT